MHVPLRLLIGRVNTITGASASCVTTYTFDLTVNRLGTTTSKQVNGTADTVTISDLYDSDDRLLSEKSVDAATAANDTFTTYAYGGTSNPGTQLTNETVYGGTDTTGAIQSVTQYQYNLQGQMSQASVNTSTSSGTSHSTSTYGYDPDGNRVSQSVVSDNGVPTAPVTTSTTYLVDENNPTGYAQTIEEFTNNSTAPSRTYVIGMDVIAQSDSHGLLTFLYDGHGSTRGLINASKQVVQRFAYDAYGNQLSASNLTSTANAFTSLLYSGQQTDPSTGLQYLRARYYSSTMGRFTTYDSYAGNSQDPLSLHKYLYADASPINGWDPTGHDFDIEGLLTTVGIGAGLGAVVGGAAGAVYNSVSGISMFSRAGVENLLYFGIGGGVVGALFGAAAFVGGGGLTAAGFSGTQLVSTLQVGIQELYLKFFSPISVVHPKTISAGVIGFVAGAIVGWEEPDLAIGLIGAGSTGFSFAINILGNGIFTQWHTLIPGIEPATFAHSLLYTVRTITNAGSTLTLAAGIGFTVGFTVGAAAHGAYDSLSSK